MIQDHLCQWFDQNQQMWKGRDGTASQEDQHTRFSLRSHVLTTQEQ